MSIAYRISGWNRDRKWRQFLQHFSFSPTTKVLDVGFSNLEYSETDNYLEKHFPYLSQVTALGIEPPTEFSQKYPAVRAVMYDGMTFPFRDHSFDIGWSNAVLEHVGDRDAQVRFLREIARVCKRAFVTTPNRLFPIEVHTRVPLLHLVLSKKMFDYFVTWIGKGWAAGSYMRLLSYREIVGLLHDAGVTEYQITRNRIGPFTLDFVIHIGRV